MGITQRRTDKELIQERAVKTREKILATALRLYMERGYHAATVDEIAKTAGLSTGIAYRYFRNKKELLLSALTYAFENIKEIAGVSEEDLYKGGIEDILTAFERIHSEYRAFHEELEGLRHSDEDVKKLYEDFTEKALTELYERLPDEIKSRDHAWERLHMAIGFMENYCHAYMDKTLDDEGLRFMRDETVRLTKAILTEDGHDI